MQREIKQYDPREDAAERWPDWLITFSDMKGIAPIVYRASKQTILLDSASWWGREDEGFAQAVAHLDWGHPVQAGGFTKGQRRQAEWLAQVRLDTEESRQLLTAELDGG